MILPNKLIPFNKCVLAKVVHILKELGTGKKSCVELFAITRSRFEDINEYILALDILYVLEKIEVDEKGVIDSHAKTN
jgi:hypothetical protein